MLLQNFQRFWIGFKCATREDLSTIIVQALYIHACLLIQTSHTFGSKDVIHDLRRQKSSSQSSNSCSNCHACSTTPLLTAVLLLTVRLGIHWLLVGLLGISTLVCRLICRLICRLLVHRLLVGLVRLMCSWLIGRLAAH